MWFKKVLGIMLIIVVTISAVACGGSKAVERTDNIVTDGKVFAGQKLTVGIWGGNDTEEAALNQVKSDFEKLTGATVELKVYTDYNTQIQADFIGRTAPDVFYVDAYMFPFLSSLGVLEPLDSVEMNIEDYYPELVDAFTSTEGLLYSVPKDVSTLATYYNIGLLESVGLTSTDIPDNLEEYIPFLTMLQEKLDETYGVGQIAAMTYNRELARLLHLLERDGASIIDEEELSNLNATGIRENLAFILSLVRTNAYKTPTDLGLGWNGEVFGAGKTVIMEEGNWVYGELLSSYSDIEFGVKDMPAYQGVKSSMFFTVGYGIYAGSENKVLAKEWIKYATGVEGMTTWCSGVGTLPSRQDVADVMNLEENQVLTVHLEQLPYAIPWQKGRNMDTINNAFENFFPAAEKEGVSLEEVLEKIDTQVNNEIRNMY